VVDCADVRFVLAFLMRPRIPLFTVLVNLWAALR